MSGPNEQRRTGLPAGPVLIGVALLTLAAIAGMVFAYYKMIRYERVAAYHVPVGATFAARVDLEQVILYEPVRKHLLALLNGAPIDATGLGQAAHPTRLSRIEKKTGIKLGLDIRELLIALGPAQGEWVAVMGGLFPRNGVIQGIDEALREEGSPTVAWSPAGDALILQPCDIWLTQATDGALVAASSEEELNRALTPQSDFTALGLSATGAGGFGLDDRFAQRILSLDPTTKPVSVRRAFGEIRLGTDTSVTVTIDLDQSLDAARLAEQASALKERLRVLAAAVPGTDFAGERALFARAETIVHPPSQIVFSAIWERSDIERGAENLADWLRRRLSPSPGSTVN